MFRVLLCSLMFFFRSCSLGYLVTDLQPETTELGRVDGDRSGEHGKTTPTKKMHRPLNVAQPQVSLLAAETVKWFERGGDPKEDEREGYRSCSLMLSVSAKVAM